MGIPKEGDDGIHAVGVIDGEAIKIPADAHERYYVLVAPFGLKH